MKFSICLILLLLLYTNFLFAQHVWRHTNGPNGGMVGDMVINSNGEIYTGVYRFFTPTLEFKNYSGLYKSTDNGNSWNEIKTQFDPFKIYALYITKAGNILVGTTQQGRIYRSTDNGVSWENNDAGYNSEECWAFGETNDGLLFAGSAEGAVYKSSNGGDSWEFSNNLSALCFAADSSDIIYCGTHSGLYKSTDKGESWTNFNLFSGRAVSSMIIDAANHLYISTGYFNNGNGVYYSSDCGNNWTHLGLEGQVTLSLAFDSKGALYAGTIHEGLFKTTDMGGTWSQHRTGIEFVQVFRLKINSQDQIFVGAENEGVFRSTNDGDFFTQVGLPISNIQNVDFSPDKKFIFAATPSGVHMYNRTTGIWENKGLLEIEAVSVSPSGDLYAASFINGIYRSSNNGDNWEFISNTLNSLFNFKAVTDSLLIEASYPNFKISTDRGISWDTTMIHSSPSRNAILYSADSKSIFIHGSLDQSKIFYSTNNGQSFSEILAPASVSTKNGLAINSFGDLFFSSTQGNNQLSGIYRSSYPYVNWLKLYTGLTYSITIDTGNIIYAGVNDGVIRSTDNGNNWVNIFSENKLRAFANDLIIDGSKLFIATNSYGLYEMQIVTSVENENHIITESRLLQNYPNPFNPKTIIRFEVNSPGIVEIKIFDILGKELLTLLNEYRQTGSHEIEFDAAALKNIPSGVYFYRMINGNYSETRKMVLLR